jgi:hypothetical protein
MPNAVDPRPTSGWRSRRLLHVLFLNTRGALGADVSVHISLARTLNRQGVRVTAATGAYEVPGDSAHAAFASLTNIRLLTRELGRPLSGVGRLGRIAAAVHTARGAATLLPLASWCRRNHVDVVHVTDRPRDALFGLLLARLAGSRCLIHAHTNYYRHDASRLSDWTLQHADAIVGVSRFTADK